MIPNARHCVLLPYILPEMPQRSRRSTRQGTSRPVEACRRGALHLFHCCNAVELLASLLGPPIYRSTNDALLLPVSFDTDRQSPPPPNCRSSLKPDAPPPASGFFRFNHPLIR